MDIGFIIIGVQMVAMICLGVVGMIARNSNKEWSDNLAQIMFAIFAIFAILDLLFASKLFPSA